METMPGESMGIEPEDEYPAYDLKAEIECICPKCRKRHTMQLHWTGDFTPRKYCRQCRSQVD
ncbi:MAG: hypothetical protein LJE94_12360 [Deltaproteobacteria bacterium]|nr:hypothetical protein [Deltaproteobacteria bacterium]